MSGDDSFPCTPKFGMPTRQIRSELAVMPAHVTRQVSARILMPGGTYSPPVPNGMCSVPVPRHIFRHSTPRRTCSPPSSTYRRVSSPPFPGGSVFKPQVRLVISESTTARAQKSLSAVCRDALRNRMSEAKPPRASQVIQARHGSGSGGHWTYAAKAHAARRQGGQPAAPKMDMVEQTSRERLSSAQHANLPALPSRWATRYEVVAERPIIGAGAFGSVLRVCYKSTQQVFACKVINRSFLEARGIGAQIQAEIAYMHHMSFSNHVVKLFAAIEEAGCMFLLLELCAFGSLEAELRSKASGRLTGQRAAVCSKHMLQGLTDLHSMGIIHRDIKLDNLLVSSDVNGLVVKLADFGWACLADSQPRDLAGTFHKMAPEVLKGDIQTTAIDVWSAGVCVYEMIIGHSFVNARTRTGASHLDHHQAVHARKQLLLAEIETACPLSFSARPPHVCTKSWDLLSQLLRLSPAQRLSAADALGHVWLRLAKECFSKPSPETPATSIPATPSTRSISSSPSIQSR